LPIMFSLLRKLSIYIFGSSLEDFAGNGLSHSSADSPDILFEASS
jgi:hypothetical protein